MRGCGNANGLGRQKLPEAVSFRITPSLITSSPHLPLQRNSGLSTPSLTTSFRYMPAAACPGTAQAMR
jgi:hypothetical protein